MRTKKKMGAFPERLFKLVKEEDAEREKNNLKPLSNTEYGKSIGKSRTAFESYMRSESTPDYETLHAIAERFNVSVDYLLGFTDVKKQDASLRSICDYTGLSEDAVSLLHEARERVDHYMSVPLHTKAHEISVFRSQGTRLGMEKILEAFTEDGESRNEATANLEASMATLDFINRLIVSGEFDGIIRNYVKMKQAIGNGSFSAKDVRETKSRDADKWESAEFSNLKAFSRFYEEALSHSAERWKKIKDLGERFYQAGITQEPRTEDREEK